MLDQFNVDKRKSLLLDLALFHEKRARECLMFHEPEARFHRNKTEKLKLVIANIERNDNK